MTEIKRGYYQKIKYQRPRGTYDLFGKKLRYFNKILEVCQKIAKFYGFQRIETPIIEQETVFSRGVGLGTDIVEKEMFVIREEKQNLALRPEGTAPVARAYIENGMKSWPKPVKLWYFGPFFRHERPQAGRYRQFWHFGVEALGRKNPVIDAQIIQLFHVVLKELGIKGIRIEINSIGCPRCRRRYIKELSVFLRPHRSELCLNCQKRLKKNVLRVLDCKEQKCQAIVREAPQILDTLWKKCRIHFKTVLEFLDSLGLPYQLNPYLVRGLDYYTQTVFEIIPDSENSLALGGGGRYDSLIGVLGGQSTPGCGAAFGIERIVELMEEKSIAPPREKNPDVFLAQLGVSAKRKAIRLMEEFRKGGLLVAEDFSRDSLASQLTKANGLGVKYTLILGKKEITEDEIILRNMKEKTQERMKLKDIIKEVKKLIK